jgi:small ligand-binding sensory domain FIST
VGLIRTILGVDEDAGSLTLAGSVDPQGYLRLMHSNTDKLIDGAEYAATLTGMTNTSFASPVLALLVSCVGRKLVMGDRVDEEVEAVNDLLTARLGIKPTLTGFYSYGEINPQGAAGTCNLHNQTMTIALISEAPAQML